MKKSTTVPEDLSPGGPRGQGTRGVGFPQWKQLRTPTLRRPAPHATVTQGIFTSLKLRCGRSVENADDWRPCRWSGCPASSILSGQRQLDFPMLFERYQQQSGLWEKWESRGFCGISKGGGKGGKPAFGFPRFPPPGFFHSPSAAAFLLLKKSSVFTLLLRTPSQRPDSSWLVPSGNSGCSVP